MNDAGETAGPSKRPRWPWLLVMLGVTAAATVAALRGRRSAEPMLVDEPPIAAPRPRSEQQEPLSHQGR